MNILIIKYFRYFMFINIRSTTSIIYIILEYVKFHLRRKKESKDWAWSNISSFSKISFILYSSPKILYSRSVSAAMSLMVRYLHRLWFFLQLIRTENDVKSSYILWCAFISFMTIIWMHPTCLLIQSLIIVIKWIHIILNVKYC